MLNSRIIREGTEIQLGINAVMSAAGVCSQPKNGRELKEGGFRPFCYGNCRVLFN